MNVEGECRVESLAWLSTLGKGIDIMYLELISLVTLIFSVLLAGWVYADADKLRRCGVRLSPIVWAILTFLFWILGLPAYFLMKRLVWNQQVSDSDSELDVSGYEPWREVGAESH